MPSVQWRPYAASCGALLPAACSLAVGVSQASASPAPVVVDADGGVSLSRVTGGGISFPVARGAEARSFPFTFAPGADQGPDTWYLIRLDVSVAFEPDAKAGSVLVSGFSRGQAGAQVEFYPGQTKGGKPTVNWASVDLIRGQAEGRSRGRKAQVHYLNYLPFAGVHPGPSTLTFQVERFGGARVSEVKIGPASGVYATEQSPVELEVAADIPDEEVVDAGEPTRLEVEVTNTSARVAHDVAVTVMPQASHMFVEGPARRTIKRLQGTETASFTIGRTRPGKLRVKASASAPNGAEGLAVVEAQVAEGTDEEKSFVPWIGLAAAAIAIAASAVLFRRRKSKGEKS